LNHALLALANSSRIDLRSSWSYDRTKRIVNTHINQDFIVLLGGGVRSMILSVWEFRVKQTMRAEFLRYYSSTGLWVTLFRKNPAYKETRLLHDTQDENRYITVDFWENEEALESFKKKFGEEYKALDKECEEFTEFERSLGTFKMIET